MLPVMSVKGDHVVTLTYYRRGKGIVVGDLVDFVHPVVPGEGVMKRVIGLPGDFVLKGERNAKGEHLMNQVSHDEDITYGLESLDSNKQECRLNSNSGT